MPPPPPQLHQTQAFIPEIRDTEVRGSSLGLESRRSEMVGDGGEV